MQWTKGSIHSPLSLTLLTPSGSALNLTGITGSAISATLRPNVPTAPYPPAKALGGTATIVSATAGTITYQFVAADVAVRGSWILTVTATFGDGPVTALTTNFDIV